MSGHPSRGWLLAASVLWWIAAAALIPADDYFYGETARDEALSIAANSGLFRAFHVVTAIGVGAGVVGVAVLARWLARTRQSRALFGPAMIAAGALVAWLVEVAIPSTARVADAQAVAAGTRSPASAPAVGSWPLFAVAAVGFLMRLRVGAGPRRLPGRRSALAVAVVATLASVAATATLARSLLPVRAAADGAGSAGERSPAGGGGRAGPERCEHRDGPVPGRLRAVTAGRHAGRYCSRPCRRWVSVPASF